MDYVLADIKERLNKKNIHAVRRIAREVGVSSPTDGKHKEYIIDEILSIASCEKSPAPRSLRGAPPKADEFDRELVADIRECMKFYAAKREGVAQTGVETSVSDGTEESGCAGILVKGESNSFLRVNGCLASEDDVFVPESYITRFNLRAGDFVTGQCRRKAPYGIAGLTKILSVNGCSPNSVSRREFSKLTPVYPESRIRIGVSAEDIAARMIDMFAPVGMGQRAVISAPANSCKTDLVKQIATAISSNERDISVIIFIVSGSPEEITDIKRSVSGAKVFYTTFSNSSEESAKAAEFVAAYCKSSVECGANVALIVDGLSKLGGAAKGLLSSAICAEEGGSLTVIATVSGEGEYSSEFSKELMSMANMRVALLSEPSVAIDVANSYTQNCALLQSKEELKIADALRALYRETGDINQIVQKFKSTQTNTEIK